MSQSTILHIFNLYHGLISSSVFLCFSSACHHVSPCFLFSCFLFSYFHLFPSCSFFCFASSILPPLSPILHVFHPLSLPFFPCFRFLQVGLSAQVPELEIHSYLLLFPRSFGSFVDWYSHNIPSYMPLTYTNTTHFIHAIHSYLLLFPRSFGSFVDWYTHPYPIYIHTLYNTFHPYPLSTIHSLICIVTHILQVCPVPSHGPIPVTHIQSTYSPITIINLSFTHM